MRILPSVMELPEVDEQLEELKRLHYPSYREAVMRDQLAGRGKKVSGTGEMLRDYIGTPYEEKQGGSLWEDG